MPPQSPERVIVITGASGGIGRATAHAFSRTGARLALAARDGAGLEQAAAECVALGGKPLVCVTDMSSPEQVDRLAETLIRHDGESPLLPDILPLGKFAGAFRAEIDRGLAQVREIQAQGEG